MATGMQRHAFKAVSMTEQTQLYVGGAGAITSHLFILAINNSGSTFLARALACSSGAWGLPREGQHIAGFVGPSSRGTGTGLLWAATPEREAQFTDPKAYDWAQSRRAWHFQAQAYAPDGSVLVLSSPPFLLIAEELAHAFPDARFLLMTRNPLPVIEGILRGTAGEDASAQHAVLDDAVAHVLRAMEVQLHNRAALGDRVTTFSYEAMCATPDAVGAQISRLVPALGPVDLDRQIAVKGNYDERLRNMNDDQLARLDPALRSAIEQRLAQHAELLAQFGYQATLS
jgi:hypothetical protein